MKNYFSDIFRWRRRRRFLLELADEMNGQRDHSSRIYFLYKLLENKKVSKEEFQFLNERMK